jgi:hypothetical protein
MATIPIGGGAHQKHFHISTGWLAFVAIVLAIGLVSFGIVLGSSSAGGNNMLETPPIAEQPIQEPAPFTQEAQEAYEQRVANAPVAVKPQSKPIDPVATANAEKIADMLGNTRTARKGELQTWFFKMYIRGPAACHAPWRYTADPYQSSAGKAVVIADIPGCTNAVWKTRQYAIVTTYTTAANGTVVPTNLTFSQTK